MKTNPETPQHIIRPREVDVGGLVVRRALPSREIRAVGPWVFFDHIGPASFLPGKGIDVLPHPHINLATVTYLFEGELVHRDSIGSIQTITPGDVNLMVAAKGIVHSERTGPRLRAAGHDLAGIQLWHALPEELEEIDPIFFHYPSRDLPKQNVEGVELRVMIGKLHGLESPAKTYSPTLYAEARMPKGSSFNLGLTGSKKGEKDSDRAIYLLSGNIRHRDTELPLYSLTIFSQESDIKISAIEDSRIVIIGGKPMSTRYIWWNFVSSRSERIEKAKADWQAGLFGVVPGETDFYPLPESDTFSRTKD